VWPAWEHAERRAAAALLAVRPDTAGRVVPALARARATGLGKLWAAVCRERFGGASGSVRGPRAVLRLPDGTVLTGPGSLACAFAAHDPGLSLDGARDGRRIDHPCGLLGALASALGAPPPGWAALAAELAESVANHALGLVAEALRRAARVGEGPAPGAPAWALRRALADPGFSPLSLFEQSVVDGHPLHPCARIRGGMDPADLFRHAPEWAEVVPVRIVAVATATPVARAATSDRRSDASRPLAAQLRRWHAAEVDAAEAHLRRTGSEAGGYDLVPVHPWQLEHALPRRFGEAIDRGEVMPVPGVAIPARPLLALRTLAPAADRRAAHLKTAVDVRLTTAVRGVSPASACNGPAASALVREICRIEHGFGGRFRVLAEQAGGGYRPRAGDPDAAASLSAIVRESPELATGPGEVVAPCAALAARSPTTGRLLACDVLAELAAGVPPPAAGRGDHATAARFLAAWCDCALPALFTLLSRWGVGLEPHGENLLVVLHGGAPVRVLYRDFGGVRIHRGRLAAAGGRVVLGGAVPTDDEDELRAKFLFPLVETNLGQLVHALAAAGGCEPACLWGIVAGRARAAYATLCADPAIGRQAAADREALFAARLPAKAMLATQLAGTPHAARWVSVANPLAASP
jgi:siderophore synthetase component